MTKKKKYKVYKRKEKKVKPSELCSIVQPTTAVLPVHWVAHPDLPPFLLNRIEAPTGHPAHAWTAQEKIDCAAAMKKIIEREKQGGSILTECTQAV